MKKILITGYQGQLGRALNYYFKDSEDFYIYNCDINEMDISNYDESLKYVSKIQPDLIINCAAFTKVDDCERNQDIAYRINAQGVINLCNIANELNSILVHISTDYIFDGNSSRPYKEDDIANPISIYGKSKWEGEKFVIENCNKFFIIRTSWLYGDGNNFIRTMIDISRKKDIVEVVEDQIGTPTSAKELAVVIHKLILTDKYGVYNVTGKGSCTWYEFAKYIFQCIGKEMKVIPVKTSEYKSKVNRPHYSILDNTKIENLIDYKIPLWNESVREYIKGEIGKMNNQNIKVLVTGANGYVGRHVVVKLLDMGYHVIASDFNFDGVDNRAEFNKNEIFSGDEDIYTQLGEPDILIHLAWRNGFVHNDFSHIQDLPKHYEFLANMLKGGLKNLSVMGSMHEVGYWEGAINEDTPTNPVSLYGISKNALRQLCLNFNSFENVSVKWLRAYYIMGDDLKNNSIFSKIIQKAESGEKTFPLNSGKNKYDFIDVDMLAMQIANAATQKEINGIINCCTGEPISLGEKVEEFISQKGYDLKLEYGVFPDRPYDSPVVYGNPTKIKKIMETNKEE